MITITKEEAQYIRDHSNDIHIFVTSKHKNKRQKKRYADEMPETFRLLRQFRKEQAKAR